MSKARDAIRALTGDADPVALAKARAGAEREPGKLYLSRGMPVAASADLTRVLALPRRPPLDSKSARAGAIVDLISRRLARPLARGNCPCGCGFACDCARIDARIAAGKRRCIVRPKPAQAWALYEIGVAGGLLANLPVGAGKTFLDVVAPMMLRDHGVELSLLLVPPNLLQQLYLDAQLIAQHHETTKIVIHGIDKRVEPPGARGLLHVLPYSRLSLPTASDWVRNLGPDAIIADECFPGDTRVITDEGDLTMREIVDEGRGRFALARSARSKQLVWRRITARARKHTSKPRVKVLHERGEFVCTVDHRIWTERGYVQAQSLEPADLLSVCRVRPTVQAEADHEALLLEGMRDQGASEGDRRDVHAESRRAGTTRTHLHPVQAGLLGAPARSWEVLQQGMRRSEPTSAGSRVRGLSDDVHTQERQYPVLHAEVRRLESTGEDFRPGLLQDHGGVRRLPSRVSHEIKRADDGPLLLKSVRCEPRADGFQGAVARRTPARTSVGVQREPRGALGSAGEAQGQDVPLAWRERPANPTAITPAGRDRGAGVGDGVSDLDGSSQGTLRMPAGLLQGGSWIPGSETRCRGGRQVTSDEEVEIPRPPEDRDLEFSRVVSVTLLESGGAGGDRSGCERDPVYDLTVEGEHNYFADGVLVSNCDRLKNPDGAGSSRILRYFQERGDGRPVHFCGWTGSLTDQSLVEFGHLLVLALRERSPLPIERTALEEWARAVDAVECPAPPGELGRLCDDEREDEDPTTTAGVRAAVGRRLAETLGVVISTEASVAVELVVQARPAPAIPEVVNRALGMVRNSWVRPDSLVSDDPDEELTTAFEVAKVARELASGIFYRWRYPLVGGQPQRREVIKEWLEARRDWHRELRMFLRDRREWLDSPHLCEHAAQRYWGDRPKRDDRPEWDSVTWPRWRDMKSRVVYETEACRVSDYLVVDAAQWARDNLGIVWYSMVDFGRWVSEVSGLPMHGGGPEAEVRLIGGEHKGKRYRGEVGDRTIIASIDSHGRGRNGLQMLFSRQLIAQVPSGATRWEQLLGRTARDGQEAPRVEADFYDHTPELRDAYEAACLRAEYVRGLTRQEQMILRGRRD